MFIGLSAELDNYDDRGEDTQSEAEFGRRHISSSGRTGASADTQRPSGPDSLIVPLRDPTSPLERRSSNHPPLLSLIPHTLNQQSPCIAAPQCDYSQPAGAQIFRGRRSLFLKSGAQLGPQAGRRCSLSSLSPFPVGHDFSLYTS